MIFDQDKITDPGILQLIKVNEIDFHVLGQRLDIKIHQCAKVVYTFYSEDSEMTRDWLSRQGYIYEGYQIIGSMKQQTSIGLFSKNNKTKSGLQVYEKDFVIMILLVDAFFIKLLNVMQKIGDIKPIIYENGNLVISENLTNGLNLAYNSVLLYGKCEAETIKNKESMVISEMLNEIEQKNKTIKFLTEQSEVFKELSETQGKLLKLLGDLPSVKRKLNQT